MEEQKMTYMDEWEYNLWLSIHRNNPEDLLSNDKTASEEVGNGSVQQTQSGCSKIGLKEI